LTEQCQNRTQRTFAASTSRANPPTPHAAPGNGFHAGGFADPADGPGCRDPVVSGRLTYWVTGFAPDQSRISRTHRFGYFA
jgi:hypothetical protein